MNSGARITAALVQEEGQALVEYALALLLVAAACVLALSALGVGVLDLLDPVVADI